MRVYVPKSKALTFSNGRWHGGGEQKSPEEVTQNAKVSIHRQLRKTAVPKDKRA